MTVQLATVELTKRKSVVCSMAPRFVS